jgi:hypothetical protein
MIAANFHHDTDDSISNFLERDQATVVHATPCA